MYSIQEQFKSDALAQMNGRVRNAQLVADNILDLSRDIGVLNLRTTKASTEQFASAVRKLLGAGNPAEFMQIAASVMQPDMQFWTSYIEQLRSIAGKAGAPVTTSLAYSASTLLAPQAAPIIAWPKTAAPAPQPAASAAPEAEAPAAPEQAQPEAAIEPAPLAAAAEESSVEAPQPAVATPPAAVEAIAEVAEAMTGANKAPDAVMAASALPPEEPAVPEITVVRKTEASQPAGKPAAAPAGKKGAPARSASNRGRKG
jgi:hypothetical protein